MSEDGLSVNTVHQQLANGDWNGFRRALSDHFPVTTCVAVVADND